MSGAIVRSCDSAGDVGRTAVYACELAAFDGTDLEALAGLDELRRVVDQIVGGDWWAGPSVRVTVARTGVASSGAIVRGTGPDVEIRLAVGQLTMATVAHELAHALAGVHRGHDDRFRRAYLDVIHVLTNLGPLDRRGRRHVDQLASAFDAAGLTFGTRDWPPPDPTVVGPIAL